MKRIFIGLIDVAGFGLRFKTGFEKIGIKSDFYSYEQHIYGFKTDKIIKYSKNSYKRKIQKILLILKLLIGYDYFLYIAPFTLLPNFTDIKIFKFFGKKTMLLYTGCDVRIPETLEDFKWNPCRNCTDQYKNFVGCIIETKKKQIRIHEKLFDIICAPYEAGGYLKNFHDIFFPFNLDDFKMSYTNTIRKENRLRIFHAPSNETYKGTKYIIETVTKLKEKYDFDFILVKDTTYSEYIKELLKANLVIDQMLLGSYGSVAIEAMLMNKPVITYIREDFLEKFKDDNPFINANPDTLYEILNKILKDSAMLYDIITKGRKFVEKYHADKVVAKRFYDMFLNYRKKDKPK